MFDKHPTVNARVFLASFMIALFPNDVFDYTGAMETKLSDISTKLVNSFESLYNSIREGDPNRPYDAFNDENSRLFPAHLALYLDTFKEWKGVDEEKLIGRISYALLALYRAEANCLEDSPNDDSSILREIRDQIRSLNRKFKSINPDKFDEWNAKYPPGVREIANPDGSQASSALQPNCLFAPSSRMSNEQVAYNLLLDPNYQLDDQGGIAIPFGNKSLDSDGSLHTDKIRTLFSDAFWDSLIFDLQLRNPCYTRIQRVLCEVRDGLKEMSGQNMHAAIELVYLDDINARGESKLLDFKYWLGLFESFSDLFKRIQPPKRDEEFLKHRVELTERIKSMDVTVDPLVVVDICRVLLHFLNCTRVDAANARLRMIAPVVRDHGLEYFQGKYKDKEKQGKTNPGKVREWITFGLRCKSVLPSDPIEKIHAHAFLQLLFSQQQQTPDTIPDTALLDIRNINMGRAQLFHVLHASCILCRLKHLKVGEDIRNTASQMFVEDGHLLLSFDQLLSKLQTRLNKELPGGLNAEQTSQFNYLKCCGAGDDPVRLLM